MNKAIPLIFAALLLFSFGCTEITDAKTKDKDDKKADETIQEILAKGKSIDNIGYEMAIIKPFPITIKMYQKGKKYRGEASILGQTSIAIFDGTNAYTYDPTEDIYYKSSNVPDNSGGFDFKDFAEQALAASDLKELGEEAINGMGAKMIEFKYKGTGVDERLKTKFWISKEYGIPIKFKWESEMGSVDMEFKNIKVGSVEDSMFEVPEDKVVDMEDIMNDMVG